MTDDSKIIVDDDWKAQAQAEKQKLAKDVAEQQAQAAQQQKIPEASITTLTNQLATQAMMSLGGMADPNSGGQVMVDPVAAKYYIDTLVMIKEKTEGNLSEEEAKLLEQVAGELQMAFVTVMKHLEAQGQAPAADAAGEAAPEGEAPAIETEA